MSTFFEVEELFKCSGSMGSNLHRVGSLTCGLHARYASSKEKAMTNLYVRCLSRRELRETQQLWEC